jgi:hypothetical protein
MATGPVFILLWSGMQSQNQGFAGGESFFASKGEIFRSFGGRASSLKGKRNQGEVQKACMHETGPLFGLRL